MKKFLIGCIFFYSFSMSASSWNESLYKIFVHPMVEYPLVHASLTGLVAATIYQKNIGKKSEDTLFIGIEDRWMPDSMNLTNMKIEQKDDGATILIVPCHQDVKIGVGLAGIFFGFKTGSFADEVNNENKKNISKNDWNALAVGALTGAVTYGLLRYIDKK